MSSLPEENPNFRNAIKNKKASRIRYLQQVQSDAEHISQLVIDPHWEVYGRKLEEGVAHFEGQVRMASEKLNNKFMDPVEYGHTKVMQAYDQGRLDGLNFSLSIARVIIERGEDAVKELNIIDKKGESE